MIKNLLKKIGKSILVCGVGILMFSCTPEDGKDGIQGVNGVAGPVGAAGVGFVNAAKYGSITLTSSGPYDDYSSGTLQQGTFNQVSKAIYALETIDYGNSVRKLVNKVGTTTYNFRISRAMDINYNGEISLNLVVTIEGDNPPTFQLRNDFNYIGVMNANGQFLGSIYEYSGVLNSISLSNYSYNETTKNLKFEFSRTGNFNPNYTFTCVVDITVVEVLSTSIGQS